MAGDKHPGSVAGSADERANRAVQSVGERQFTVLGRSWCHLCDDLLAALQPLASEFGWTVEVLDIDQHPALLARWDELVPVLLHQEHELCHYHLDAAAVRAYCAAFR